MKTKTLSRTEVARTKYGFSLDLPEWLVRRLDEVGETPFDSDELKMRFAIELARTNVESGSGGPFGAAVFEAESGFLVSAGVNLVEGARASIAHAEIVALTLAQQSVDHFDLGAPDLPRHELFSSTEPCAMCLGSIPWSGVERLVCAATAEDAEAIGFDEGAKPEAWVHSLEIRGVRVDREMLRSEGKRVLEKYSETGGLIY